MTAAPFVLPERDVSALAAAAASCTGCLLYAAATQTVFGEGARRDDVYTTDAVKHFKHEVPGKRRLHRKPGTAEIEACHPWLTAEIEAVRAALVEDLRAAWQRSRSETLP